jgi:hypothetical protein
VDKLKCRERTRFEHHVKLEQGKQTNSAQLDLCQTGMLGMESADAIVDGYTRGA